MRNEWKIRARGRGVHAAFKKINNKGMLSSILKIKVPAKVSDKMTGEITDICSLERAR